MYWTCILLRSIKFLYYSIAKLNRVILLSFDTRNILVSIPTCNWNRKMNRFEIPSLNENFWFLIPMKSLNTNNRKETRKTSQNEKDISCTEQFIFNIFIWHSHCNKSRRHSDGMYQLNNRHEIIPACNHSKILIKNCFMLPYFMFGVIMMKEVRFMSRSRRITFLILNVYKLIAN